MSSVAFAFDGKNEAAQLIVDEYVRSYTWTIATSSRLAINNFIERAIREGIPPLEAAKLIKEVIGLDPKRFGAVSSFREKLVADGRSAAAVNKSTARYSAKLLRARAQTIARTETMAAMNAGSLESYKQAQAEGLLEEDAGKEWMVTPDDALCEICAPMTEEAVPLNETFSNGLESPPAHPRCRCALGPATAAEVAESTLASREPAPRSGFLPRLAAAAVTTVVAANVGLGAGRLAAVVDLLR